MAKKKVIVDVQETGELSVEAEGFEGQGCVEVTSSLIKALGGDPRDFEAKPEYQECRKTLSNKRNVNTRG